MRNVMRIFTLAALFAATALLPGAADATVHFQCPAAVIDPASGLTDDPAGDVYCKHLTAGDGFATMADGKVLYTFGFKDVTDVAENDVMMAGMLGAQFSAPTLKFPEGSKVFLTITNVGMVMRPDLFDPHSLHWHGFPNAAPIFDGEPMSSISVNMGSSLSYYYETPRPGTYMYHCHVEATEHMQMGMLGNLYVTPAQDGTTFGGYSKFAYNDGDGSTGYDRDYPVQLASFDPVFHEQHINVQPLPFANMKDTYPMINGRGYPDTVTPGPLAAPAENGYQVSQALPALITATQGERILLRFSSLSTVEYYTVGLSGLTMRVVGKDARLLRNSGGVNLYYMTTSLTIGGGQSVDAIIDTAGVAPGTYFLYAKNLNHLSNDKEDVGGMMTEIVIAP